MNKIKTTLNSAKPWATLIAMLLTLIIAVPSFAQDNRHRNDRNDRRDRVERNHRERSRDYKDYHYNRERRPSLYINRNPYQNRRRSVVIIPRINLRFPYTYRGSYANTAYDIGYRDGFLRGVDDARKHFPCDVDFVFDYKYSMSPEYKQGYIKGYYQACN